MQWAKWDGGRMGEGGGEEKESYCKKSIEVRWGMPTGRVLAQVGDVESLIRDYKEFERFRLIKGRTILTSCSTHINVHVNECLGNTSKTWVSLGHESMNCLQFNINENNILGFSLCFSFFYHILQFCPNFNHIYLPCSCFSSTL